MRILVVAERTDPEGRRFKTVELLPHVPVETDPGIAGWEGARGSGLSDADLKDVFESLRDTAENIQVLRVELVGD